MFLIIILVTIVGLVNFFYLLPPVVNWDEGTHSLWGFKEWLAMRSGDWHLFWQLSRDQFSYPPLGSWLIAFTNLPTEFSLNLARFSSTLGFIVGGILLLKINHMLFIGNHANFDSASDSLAKREIDSTIKSKSLAIDEASQNLVVTSLQYLSIFLFLTSPAILFYSVTVFKESWGMALTLLTIYLYFKAIENPVILTSEARPESVEKDSGQARMTLKQRLFLHLLTSLSLALLFFEKYNYSLLLMLVLGLEGAVEIVLIFAGPASRFVGRRFSAVSKDNSSKTYRLQHLSPAKLLFFIYSQLALFLPFVLLGSWWILTPDNKLDQFLNIMRSDWNPVTVGVGNSWQYLTFFAQSIRISYTFSNVLFLLIVICYLLSVKDLWQKKIRVLWLFFTLNFVLGTLHSINLQDRYILTSVPALFLLVGYEGQKIISFFLDHPGNNNVLSLYVQKKEPKKKGTKNWLFIIGNWILELAIGLLVLLVFLDFLKLPQLLKSNATHMLLSPMYNEKDYHDTLFDFNKNDWPHFVPQGGTSRGKPQVESPEAVIDYILDNVDITKPINYMGWTAEISPDWVELRRQLRIRQIGKIGQIRQGNYLVTIEVSSRSRLYTYDYRRANLWQMANIADFAKNNTAYLVEEKHFRELGIIVNIYKF